MNRTALLLVMALIVCSCNVFAQATDTLPTVMLSEDLELYQIEERTWVVNHIFPWPSNSMIAFLDSGKVLFADTPITPEATQLVLDWIETQVENPEIIEINTHYHVDCLGGNEVLLARGFSVYGSDKSVELLAEDGELPYKDTAAEFENPKIRAFYETFTPVPPDHVFPLNEGMQLNWGGERIEVHYPGHAHTIDNVVVWLPDRKILFGGCMVRAWTSIGNMKEADAESWVHAVDYLERFDPVRVVPGHGGLRQKFSPDLIDLTRDVMQKYVASQGK